MNVQTRGSVRFQEIPTILEDQSLLDESSNQSDSLDLLKALNADDYSTTTENLDQDRTVFDDSQYNRVNFVGRTPHSKVVDAKKNRRALQELMKVPSFANYQFNDTINKSKDLKFESALDADSNKSSVYPSKMISSTNSMKSMASDSSYHFDLVVEGEENAPNPSSLADSIRPTKANPGVRFDEKSLIQNRLETPAVARKAPMRKTPMPQMMFSKHSGNELEECEESIINSRPMHSKELSEMDDKSNSLDISQISFIEKEKTQLQQTQLSNSTSSADSPLASLISRPDISKASPVMTIPSPEPRKVDAATSYSFSLDLPIERKMALGVDVCHVGTSYSPPPNVNDYKGLIVVQQLEPEPEPERESSHSKELVVKFEKKEDPSTTSRKEGILEVPTPGLEKLGGVAFGKGPVVSNIAHHVASMRHTVNSTDVVPISKATSISPPVKMEEFSVVKHENPVCTDLALPSSERESVIPKQGTFNLQPAINWYSPRNTRKPVPSPSTHLPFGQNHHIVVHGEKKKESTMNLDWSQENNNRQYEPKLVQLLSQTSSLHPNIVPRGYFSSLQPQHSHIPAPPVSSRPELRNAYENRLLCNENFDQSASIDEYSYTLEELMSTFDDKSTFRQSNQTLNNTTFTSHASSMKSSRNGNKRFDLTTCNIGGSPSTLYTAPEEILSTSYAQVHHLNPNQQVISSEDQSKHFSFSSISQSNFQYPFSATTKFAQNQSFGSSLGIASRVPKAIAEQMWAENLNEEENSVPLVSSDIRNNLPKSSLMNDVTILTDIAVANFKRDFNQQISNKGFEEDELVNQSMQEDDDDLGTIPTSTSLNTTNQAGYETTFTLDHSFFQQQNGNGNIQMENSNANIYSYPRLAIKSLKRDENNPFDIKEIGFETSPNELMTVMLTFKNDHIKKNVTSSTAASPIQLSSKAVFLRVEPLYNKRNTRIIQKNLQDVPSLNNEEKEEVFTVSPEKLVIPYQEEGMLFITFAPKYEGIYSGVLQVKYQKKSLIVLLRGECSEKYSVENQSMNSPQQSSSIMNLSRQQQVNTPETTKQQPRMNNNTKNTPESMNSYENVSPGSFQEKLGILQKKIFEISQKITLKDVVNDSLSSSKDFSYRKSITSMQKISEQEKKSQKTVKNQLPPTYKYESKTMNYPSSSNNNNYSFQSSTVQPQPSVQLTSFNASSSVLASGVKTVQTTNYQADTEKSSSSQKFLVHQPSPKMEMPTSMAIESTTRNMQEQRQQQQQQQQGGNAMKTTTTTTNTTVSVEMNQLNVEDDQQINQELIQSKKRGFYFRFPEMKFGSVMIGSLVRTKIVLCNATNHEVLVYLGDLSAPFFNHHAEVRMRPKSFIRIPIRFIPRQSGIYQQQLVAQTADGKYQTVIDLIGEALSVGSSESEQK